MSDYAALFNRLALLAEKTSSATALGPAAWWDGDLAGKRQVLDDLAAGRVAWRAAHKAARYGLDALKSGDLETAEICARAANDHYVAALEARARTRPAEMEALGRPPARRGRRRKKTEK